MYPLEREIQRLLVGCALRAAQPLRWLVFRTNQGMQVGREVLDPAYTSKRWIRIAVRTPEGTQVIRRDVRKHHVQRLNRVDEMEYKQDRLATLRLVADIRRSMVRGSTGEQDMD